MPTMILAHPRSRSTQVLNCFKNNLGEIFNLHIVNPESYELGSYLDPDPLFVISKKPWVKNYINYIFDKIEAESECAFKVFYEHIIFNNEIQNRLQTLSLTTIYIKRVDELAAIKSLLVAVKRGFTKETEQKTTPFYTSPAAFYYAYTQCVIMPNLAKSIFKIDYETTYETFDTNNFPYLQIQPQTMRQDSVNTFQLLENELEIERWYKALL